MFLKRNLILILMAFIVFSGLLVRYLDRVPDRHYCDFRVYYKAGQDFIRGKNIYFRETQETTPFKYSPFFAFVFAPLSLLPIKASAAVFFTINFCLTILFFRLSFHLVQGSSLAKIFSDRESLLIYVLAVLFSLRYIFLVGDSGQVNILMCTLILAALTFLSKGREGLAGAFLAAAILIKYTPVIFLPYLLYQRKFKTVLWAILFVGLFLIVPALVVGFSKNLFYLSAWGPSIITTSLDHFSYIDSKNQSIFSMFLRFLSPTSYNVHIFFFSFDDALNFGRIAAVILYLAVFIPGKLKPRDMVIDSAVLMICMSLFNPNGWVLSFVSLGLPCMLLIQYLFAIKGKDRFVLFLLITTFILTNIMSRDLLGKGAEAFGCAYSFTTLGGLLIYMALLKLKFSKILRF